MKPIVSGKAIDKQAAQFILFYYTKLRLLDVQANHEQRRSAYIDETARFLCCSTDSVRHVVACFEKENNLTAFEKKSRSRTAYTYILSERMLEFCKESLTAAQDKGSIQVLPHQGSASSGHQESHVQQPQQHCLRP